jgi:hypothetical protein
MIIDRVHVAHPVFDELVVKSRPEFRAHFDSERDNPFLRSREKHEQRRAIVPRKIDAVIEFIARNRSHRSKSGRSTRHYQEFVHAGNRRCESFAFRRNHKRDLRVRKFFSRSRDCRRCQNQIADAFELNEENVQFDNWIALS